MDNLILGGDFNAHHTSWGSHKINSRGRKINNLYSTTKYHIINNGKNTYYPTQIGQKPSAIDLTIASNDIASKISWDVTDYSIGGNHHIVLISLHSEIELKEKIKKTVSKKKLIKDLESLKPNSFFDIEDLQGLTKSLIKKHSKKLIHTPKLWWCKELTEAYQNKKNARKEFNRLSNSINLRIQ